MAQEHKTTVQFSGGKGILMLLAVLILGGYRFMSFQNVRDESLKKVIINELTGDFRRSAVETMHNDHQALAETLADPGIEIIRMQMSKPLLSFQSSGKAVVKVTYRDRSKQQIKYFDLRYSAVGGYQLKEEASSVEYYMSFF